MAFVAGSFVNVLGVRATLSIGAVGYPIYAAGLWLVPYQHKFVISCLTDALHLRIYDRTGQEVPPILFGAVLGVGAGFLWSAAGFVQYAYADESQKGLYIVVQWLMVAFGSTM